METQPTDGMVLIPMHLFERLTQHARRYNVSERTVVSNLLAGFLDGQDQRHPEKKELN